LRRAVNKTLIRTQQLRSAPADLGSYRRALGDAVRRVASHSGRIIIDHARGFKLYDPRTISHLEAEGNCTVLHFADGTRYLDTRTLRVYEELLEPTVFLRVHRSHIIHLDHLREYLRDDGHWAVMRNGARIPIARERLSDFLEHVR